MFCLFCCSCLWVDLWSSCLPLLQFGHLRPAVKQSLGVCAHICAAVCILKKLRALWMKTGQTHLFVLPLGGFLTGFLLHVHAVSLKGVESAPIVMPLQYVFPLDSLLPLQRSRGTASMQSRARSWERKETEKSVIQRTVWLRFMHELIIYRLLPNGETHCVLSFGGATNQITVLTCSWFRNSEISSVKADFYFIFFHIFW